MISTFNNISNYQFEKKNKDKKISKENSDIHTAKGLFS